MTNTFCKEIIPIPHNGTNVAVTILELWTIIVKANATKNRMTCVSHLNLPGKDEFNAFLTHLATGPTISRLSTFTIPNKLAIGIKFK